jgi:hypothetical protein
MWGLVRYCTSAIAGRDCRCWQLAVTCDLRAATAIVPRNDCSLIVVSVPVGNLSSAVGLHISQIKSDLLQSFVVLCDHPCFDFGAKDTYGSTARTARTNKNTQLTNRHRLICLWRSPNPRRRCPVWQHACGNFSFSCVAIAPYSGEDWQRSNTLSLCWFSPAVRTKTEGFIQSYFYRSVLLIR